jgi:hypothetical protein
MILIYTNHLNLGFHKGTLLPDPKNQLKGTGKFIRHIPIISTADFDNDAVKDLIKAAIEIVENESKSLSKPAFQIISKIKRY